MEGSRPTSDEPLEDRLEGTDEPLRYRPRRRDQVAGAGILLFGLFAYPAVSEAPFAVEHAIRVFVSHWRSEPITELLRLVTFLGNGTTIVGATLLVTALLAGWVSRRSGVFFASAVAGAGALNQLTKWLFGRERPIDLDPIVNADGLAYPSGHSMGTLAFALAAWLVVRHHAPKHAWLIIAVGLPLVFVIGLSRIYLGVHYPSDVLGGWALGTTWVLALSRFVAIGVPEEDVTADDAPLGEELKADADEETG